MRPERAPVTLRPSRLRWILVLLASLVLGAGGVLMIADGRDIGWLVAGFFGLCAAVACVSMLPGASYLVLDEEGFTVGSLFRSARVVWPEVVEFYPWVVMATGMRAVTHVAFELSPDRRNQATARVLSRLVSGGVEAGLPDTYGLRAEELAELMNRWREHYAGPSPQAGDRAPA